MLGPGMTISSTLSGKDLVSGDLFIENRLCDVCLLDGGFCCCTEYAQCMFASLRTCVLCLEEAFIS